MIIPLILASAIHLTQAGRPPVIPHIVKLRPPISGREITIHGLTSMSKLSRVRMSLAHVKRIMKEEGYTPPVSPITDFVLEPKSPAVSDIAGMCTGGAMWFDAFNNQVELYSGGVVQLAFGSGASLGDYMVIYNGTAEGSGVMRVEEMGQTSDVNLEAGSFSLPIVFHLASATQTSKRSQIVWTSAFAASCQSIQVYKLNK